MKLCLLLSLALIVQSKPGPEPKPGPKANPKPFPPLIIPSPCQQLTPPCQPQPPPRPWPQPDYNGMKDSRCVCINPFLQKPFPQTDVPVNGDPDTMCRDINKCYVDCNSMCRDVKNAQSFGRCFSRLACQGRGRGPYP